MGMQIDHKKAESINIDKIAKEELFKAAVRTMNKWKKNTRNGEGANRDRSQGWVNTGEGVNSITIQPQNEGKKEYEVGSDKVQMAVAEFGAEPHWPPFEPIADWVNEQGGLPNKGDDDFYISVRGVRGSMAEEGVRGFAPGRKAAATVRKNLEENVKKSIERKLEQKSF